MPNTYRHDPELQGTFTAWRGAIAAEDIRWS